VGGIIVQHQAPATLSAENVLPLSFGLVSGHKSEPVWTLQSRKNSKARASNVLVTKAHTFIVACFADCCRKKNDIISNPMFVSWYIYTTYKFGHKMYNKT